MKKVFLVFTAVLFLGFGANVKAADATKAMPAIISYLLSGDSGGVVTQNDKFKRVSVNSTDGIVEDKQTGLFWQDEKYTQGEDYAYRSGYSDEEGKVLKWNNAKTYCANLTFGGHSDWRLPNFAELQTIVDTSHGPTINPIFNTIAGGFFWTSKKVSDSKARSISFDNGTYLEEDLDIVNYTRCVRGERKGQILKTGQTTSYENFDDGYYQKGVARSYTRDNAKNIVTDNATGLQWQDNEEAKTVKKNFEDAKTYCSGLTLGGHSDWRLPSIVELLSITDLGKYDPAIDSTFQNVYLYFYYWTSVNYKADTSKAWGVRITSGFSTYRDKFKRNSIRCVRGNSIESTDSCTRNSDETVTCPDTKLVWQDNAEVAADSKIKTWQEAISHCENLNFAGKNDWRLPNLNELRSIVDYKKTSGKKIKDGFTNSSSGYWSSTSNMSARNVSFNYGYDYFHDKSYYAHVRCVRAGE